MCQYLTCIGKVISLTDIELVLLSNQLNGYRPATNVNPNTLLQTLHYEILDIDWFFHYSYKKSHFEYM